MKSVGIVLMYSLGLRGNTQIVFRKSATSSLWPCVVYGTSSNAMAMVLMRANRQTSGLHHTYIIVVCLFACLSIR